MTNTAYQAAVEALEEVLAPRVVSRLLQEGLKQVGQTPESVGYNDLEKILKAQIYRQLQVNMPVTQAKEKVSQILASLGAPPTTSQEPDEGALAGQQEALEELQAALKPYNLYFEWPETQKLRAQLQLLQNELAEGRESSKLITTARLQLRMVEQKLEDQLVVQARELGEIDSGLELVRSLGGPKVRRLEALLGQIREAQTNRQLASAEVERARKLVTDLRKLLESSVVVESPPEAESGQQADIGLLDVEPADDEAILSIDTDALPPEVNARLMQLDLADELHELDLLAESYANLLQYQPHYEARLRAERERLEGQDTAGGMLPELRQSLETAQATARADLQEELKDMLEGLGAADAAVANELKQSLHVSLGVLESTLPPRADIEQIRQLYRLALERSKTQEQNGAEERSKRHAEQIAELHQLEQELREYRGLEHETLTRLTTLLKKAKTALDSGRGVKSLDPAWTLLDQLRSDLERRVAAFEPRLDKALAALDTVGRLNTDETARARRILEHLDGQRGSLVKVSASVRAQLEASLSEAETLLAGLQEQYEATRDIAGQLMSGSMLDDILGSFGAQPKPAPPVVPEPAAPAPSATVVTKVKSRNQPLDAWLDAYLNERGVRGAATFGEGGRMLAGRLEVDPQAFGSALDMLAGDVAAMGGELGMGCHSMVTLETPGHILIFAWPTPQHGLVLDLDMPAMLNLILGKLRRDLPELVHIFSGPAFA
ncbi:MAG TPA: hypothetical protein VF171_05325 [Trueperaceae bacterium]